MLYEASFVQRRPWSNEQQLYGVEAALKGPVLLEWTETGHFYGPSVHLVKLYAGFSIAWSYLLFRPFGAL